MLKQNNEQEILRAFESMLRKKIKKNQNQAAATMNKYLAGSSNHSIQHSLKSDVVRGLYRSQTLQIEKSEKSGTSRFQQKQSTTTRKKDDQAEENKEKLDDIQLRNGLKFFNYIPDIHEFCWDADNSSKEIAFSSDCRHAFLHETNYLFRTMISNRPFMDGIHYWEIIADARTEHELKIGITLQQKFSVSYAFCDYDFGFGFYGMGQLRHGSNAEGIKYGRHFKKKGILGVLLDMNMGQLSFAMDGEFFGNAF